MERTAAATEQSVTAKGKIALLVMRMLSMAGQEFVVHVDWTHEHRPRWRIMRAGLWEKAREDCDGT